MRSDPHIAIRVENGRFRPVGGPEGWQRRCTTGGRDMNYPTTAGRIPAVVSEAGFDLEAVLRTFERDEVLVRELLALFVEDCPGRVAAIDAAVDARDPAALRAAAHTLKGSLSVFGRLRAEATTLDLERMALAGDLTQADAAAARLRAQIAALLDEFGEILGLAWQARAAGHRFTPADTGAD